MAPGTGRCVSADAAILLLYSLGSVCFFIGSVWSLILKLGA